MDSAACDLLVQWKKDKSLNWVTSDNVQSLSKKKSQFKKGAVVKMRGARGAWWKGVVRDVKPIASTTLDDRMLDVIRAL